MDKPFKTGPTVYSGKKHLLPLYWLYYCDVVFGVKQIALPDFQGC
jgi:hypothetical protein